MMTHDIRSLPYADDVKAIQVDEADDIKQVVNALQQILGRCIGPAI